MKRRHILAAGIAAVVAGALPALADYPEKPVTLVIGYAAGGGTDTIARVVADEMSKAIGQPVTAVNKPGAGGGIAAMQVMRSQPDGYTVLLDPSSSITLNPKLSEQQNFAPDDFDYVGMIAAFQTALVAPKDRPYDTLEEFIAWAKENPGATYAQINPGSTMAMDVIESAAGIETRRVPTKGGAGSMNSLISGQVDIGYSGGIHQRYTDEIKVLAPLVSTRSLTEPEKPTAQELGYPVVLNSNITLAVPKGTDPAVIDKLASALEAASKTEAVKNIGEKLSFPIEFFDPEAAAAEIEAQDAAYDELIAKSKKADG
ncbi:tripartite tricarboxylate transporter substrate binding protein [Pseudooceanicola sp.]|uniref:tripartite tricarboxylate transporter substrate binding protein n=1 Tax=Pseudooceanicola sp. TaxID=1914328 RepID=UPI004057F5E2